MPRLSDMKSWSLYECITVGCALATIILTVLSLLLNEPTVTNKDSVSVGGLVGKMQGGTIENSTASGTVTATVVREHTTVEWTTMICSILMVVFAFLTWRKRKPDTNAIQQFDI